MADRGDLHPLPKQGFEVCDGGLAIRSPYNVPATRCAGSLVQNLNHPGELSSHTPKMGPVRPHGKPEGWPRHPDEANLDASLQAGVPALPISVSSKLVSEIPAAKRRAFYLESCELATAPPTTSTANVCPWPLPALGAEAKLGPKLRAQPTAKSALQGAHQCASPIHLGGRPNETKFRRIIRR